MDKRTGEVQEENPREFKSGEACFVHLIPEMPETLYAETYVRTPALGRFIMVCLVFIFGLWYIMFVFYCFQHERNVVMAVGVIRHVCWTLEPRNRPPRSMCLYPLPRHMMERYAPAHAPQAHQGQRRVPAEDGDQAGQRRAQARVVVPPPPEAVELATRYDLNDFVDVRAAGGRWHACQVWGNRRR